MTLSILQTYRTKLHESWANSPPTSRLFLLVLHDWIAYISGGDSHLPHYGMTLYTYCQEHSPPCPYMDKVGTDPYSSYSLLYRHYLAQDALRHDMMLELPNQAFHQMIKVFKGSVGLFCPIENFLLPFQFKDMFDTNIFLQSRPSIQQGLTNLANREDVCDVSIISNHGVLFSYMLLYGLFVAHTLLAYLHRLSSHPVIAELQIATKDTLTKLSGVLLHDQEN